MFFITLYFNKIVRPAINALLTRILYGGSNRVRVGKRFRADGLPRIIVDRGCRVDIGDDVEFRSGVEIRAHGQSRIRIGAGNRIDRGVRILAANQAVVSTAMGVRIGLYSVLNGGDSISIGKKSLLSGFVYLQTSKHGFRSKSESVQEQGFIHAPVVLGDDVWLGAHVVVLPGVGLGNGCVVGSNAVVTKNVAAYSIVGGVPAKMIGERG